MTDYKFTDKVKTKNEAFVEKRKEIFDEIIDVLGLEINNPQSTIKKDDLDTKYDAINKLLNDILVYYPATVTSAIQKTENKSMSAIRLILKYYQCKLKYKSIAYRKNDKKTTTQIYFIISDVKNSE